MFVRKRRVNIQKLRNRYRNRFRKKKDQRELAEGVQYWEEEIMVEHEGSKKQQSTTLLDDDDDDEVFLR